jgi:hypothetical protein
MKAMNTTNAKWHQGMIVEYNAPTKKGYVKCLFSGGVWSFESSKPQTKGTRVNFQVSRVNGSIDRVTALITRGVTGSGEAKARVMHPKVKKPETLARGILDALEGASELSDGAQDLQKKIMLLDSALRDAKALSIQTLKKQ